MRLEEILDRLLETIRDLVDTSVGGARFERVFFEDQAGELDTLLSNHVLPAQLDDGSATDKRAVILAGWLQALSRHPDDPVALIASISDANFQRFLTKALEMSAILETWTNL